MMSWFEDWRREKAWAAASSLGMCVGGLAAGGDARAGESDDWGMAETIEGTLSMGRKRRRNERVDIASVMLVLGWVMHCCEASGKCSKIYLRL